jgi:putative ABC transport system permease protein
MKYLPLVWRNLFGRRRTRTLFTVLSVMVAFVLYGLLVTIRAAFSMGVDVAGADRLMLMHKVSIILPLPISYEDRIRRVTGVADVTYATWFGGFYQDPKNFFAQMVVDPESWLRMYPEFVLPPDQKKAWLADRTGAIVGRRTAERFGWKVGDQIPIQGTIFRKKDGAQTWTFTLDGIYDGDKPGVDTTQFFFNNKYLDEARQWGQGSVGWYVVRVDDPAQSAAVAGRLDAMFANSPFETKTSTEKAFVQSFANQVGDIGAIMTAVLVAVFFTILLVTGNTMAQAVRERTSELAVLKTLGFSNGLVLVLVLVESTVLAAVGGGLGLLLALGFVRQGDPTGGLLPAFYLPSRQLALGGALILALGVASGLLPAVQAMRLRIVDALRRA